MNRYQPQIAHISCSSINHEEPTYCLRPDNVPVLDQKLATSIDRLGLLHPPLVQRHGEEYIILSGRKRILAADQLGMQEIPCLVVEDTISDSMKWEILLTHALIGSQLSFVEQAHLFAKAGQEIKDEQLLALLPILGHKKNPQLLHTFSRSLSLVQAAVKALHRGCLQPKSIDLLDKCQPQDQETLIELIDSFRLGGSKQRNLILLALDLTRRHNVSLREIIEEWQKERKGSKTNQPQQVADLFSWLAAKQAPRHHKAQQEFKKFVREIQLPASCSLSPTASFEDEQLTLAIRFADRNNFYRSWSTIRAALAYTHE